MCVYVQHCAHLSATVGTLQEEKGHLEKSLEVALSHLKALGGDLSFLQPPLYNLKGIPQNNNQQCASPSDAKGLKGSFLSAKTNQKNPQDGNPSPAVHPSRAGEGLHPTEYQGSLEEEQINSHRGRETAARPPAVSQGCYKQAKNGEKGAALIPQSSVQSWESRSRSSLGSFCVGGQGHSEGFFPMSRTNQQKSLQHEVENGRVRYPIQLGETINSHTEVQTGRRDERERGFLECEREREREREENGERETRGRWAERERERERWGCDLFPSARECVPSYDHSSHPLVSDGKSTAVPTQAKAKTEGEVRGITSCQLTSPVSLLSPPASLSATLTPSTSAQRGVLSAESEERENCTRFDLTSCKWKGGDREQREGSVAKEKEKVTDPRSRSLHKPGEHISVTREQNNILKEHHSPHLSLPLPSSLLSPTHFPSSTLSPPSSCCTRKCRLHLQPPVLDQGVHPVRVAEPGCSTDNHNQRTWEREKERERGHQNRLPLVDERADFIETFGDLQGSTPVFETPSGDLRGRLGVPAAGSPCSSLPLPPLPCSSSSPPRGSSPLPPPLQNRKGDCILFFNQTARQGGAQEGEGKGAKHGECSFEAVDELDRVLERFSRDREAQHVGRGYAWEKGSSTHTLHQSLCLTTSQNPKERVETSVATQRGLNLQSLDDGSRSHWTNPPGCPPGIQNSSVLLEKEENKKQNSQNDKKSCSVVVSPEGDYGNERREAASLREENEERSESGKQTYTREETNQMRANHAQKHLYEAASLQSKTISPQVLTGSCTFQRQQGKCAAERDTQREGVRLCEAAGEGERGSAFPSAPPSSAGWTCFDHADRICSPVSESVGVGVGVRKTSLGGVSAERDPERRGGSRIAGVSAVVRRAFEKESAPSETLDKSVERAQDEEASLEYPDTAQTSSKRENTCPQTHWQDRLRSSQHFPSEESLYSEQKEPLGPPKRCAWEEREQMKRQQDETREKKREETVDEEGTFEIDDDVPLDAPGCRSALSPSRISLMSSSVLRRHFLSFTVATQHPDTDANTELGSKRPSTCHTARAAPSPSQAGAPEGNSNNRLPSLPQTSERDRQSGWVSSLLPLNRPRFLLTNMADKDDSRFQNNEKPNSYPIGQSDHARQSVFGYQWQSETKAPEAASRLCCERKATKKDKDDWLFELTALEVRRMIAEDK
uniref:Uncharacterized protein n=1 Tax=Chromera velia CCMP2878 TaxID=1169474 RepID=A0A0G4F8L4_9ALVE|eukprot:Cvel_15793.t1-p1 / transcript=Cvel_15793.t1 / gene=Cvel_15793 / organism=Chromera_velia_CCMP2878 / gene_product=hypothetical protein / transcript_product=hypothetical protein / location=Cvel_scaffold1185:33879-37409(-) / protein_length=1177 / sequence_SO=supercontig / SO=protein_coding / is_pseudo=false